MVRIVSKAPKTGFTLIELLIVVAIIAILAAIAVPNFLEAQVRSKVSRAKNDMRTYATGVETYAIDWNNKYPYAPNSSVDLDGYGQIRAFAFLTVPKNVTTPVAYVTSFIPDVFRLGKSANAGPNTGRSYDSGDPQDLTYWYLNTRQAPTPDYQFFAPTSLDAALTIDGEWRFGSLGPQAEYLLGGAGQNLYSINGIYDPTNGTVSRGMIWRSQRFAEVTGYPTAPPLNP